MALEAVRYSPVPEQPETRVVPPGTSQMVADGTVITLELDDGSVQIMDASEAANDDGPSNHDDNLALKLPSHVMDALATQLLEDIEADDQTRGDWLQQAADALKLLGLAIETPRTGIDSSAPLEGMSTVRHPILTEAVLRFQANAAGELLPADGPVKIRVDDVTSNPPQVKNPFDPNQPPPIGHNQPNPKHNVIDDVQASTLQTDFNYYLTKVATEYYPDTRRMLFWVGLQGCGFKKVYNCPIRRRPVSEAVDARYLITSNAITDLGNAARITHVIPMRPSVVRRMQLIGAYRDVELPIQGEPKPNPINMAIHAIQGTQPTNNGTRPEQADRLIYECYCELEVPGYEHVDDDGEKTGLPLPWKVTIDSETRTVLEVRRDWKEDDQNHLRRKWFVQYPFILGMGFYGIGLLALVGNVAIALTAGWREALDNGMFHNFPGGLIAKDATRQNTSDIRVAPGQFYPINVPAGQKVGDSVAPLPYGDLSTAFMSFLDHVEKTGMRVAQAPEIAVGDGRQDAPVGTTIALLDQATKVMDSVHKGLYQAQSEEFSLLKERFLEDPDALWRFNPKPATVYDRDKFVAALQNQDLSPAADPNTASHTMRILRAQALVQLALAFPGLLDMKEVVLSALRSLRISSPEGLLAPQQEPQPDLKAMAELLKAEAAKLGAQAKLDANQVKAMEVQIDAIVKMSDIASKEKIAELGVVEKVATRPYAEDEVARTAQGLGAAKQNPAFRGF